MTKPATILITDDHKMLRETWTALLNGVQGLEVIGDAASGSEAIVLARALKPDIVLMDLQMVPVSGFDAAEQIYKDVQGVKIIGLSMSLNPAHVKRLFAAGAAGYLTKNCTFEEVVHGIQEVIKGNKYVSRDIKDILANQVMVNDDKAKDKIRLLTKKEIAIIDLIREGLSSKEIAVQQEITLKTVEVHRYNILKKLGVRNRAELVNMVNGWGL